MAHELGSQSEKPIRLASDIASAKLCMVDQQPDFSSLPPQLACLAAEVWALISSPHIRRLTRLQREIDLEFLGLRDPCMEQMGELKFDQGVMPMLLVDGLPDDKKILKLSTRRAKMRKEVSRRAGREAWQLYPEVAARVIHFLSQDKAPVGLLLELGQFAEVKSVYDAMIEIYTLETEVQTEAWWTTKMSVTAWQIDVELKRRIVAFLCSERATMHPDKAKLGFLIHFANRMEQFSEMENRLAELFRKKAGVAREMLEHYKKIQKHLAITVHIQAEQRGGNRG